MFVEAFEKIIESNYSPATVRAIEAGAAWEAPWCTVADSGFLDLLVPEERGGAQLPLSELHPILAVLGRHAVPVPIAQTICARALVPTDLPEGPITFAPALRQVDDSTICPRVPYGARARWVLAPLDDTLVLLPATAATLTPCGESHMSNMTWHRDQPGDAVEGSRTHFLAMGAALHASVMAGAMERTFQMTLNYCNERQQFGRALGKFQAVQHQLSVMAEHVAAVSVAAQAAFDTNAGAPALVPAAIAKARASRAAPLIANAAHALHGAIGVTQEYDLQLFTRMLHAWRAAHGAESYWDGIVGRALLRSGETMASFARSPAESSETEIA